VRYDEDDINEGSSIIWQSDSREFTSAGEEPDSDWTVVTDVTDIERFVLTIDPDEFTEDHNEPFRILVGGWSIEIDVMEVEAENNDGNEENESGDDGNGGTEENEETETEERIEVTVDIEGEEEARYDYENDAALEIDLVEGTIEIDDEVEEDGLETPTPMTTTSDTKTATGSAARSISGRMERR
jgi:hypothetical protein